MQTYLILVHCHPQLRDTKYNGTIIHQSHKHEVTTPPLFARHDIRPIYFVPHKDTSFNVYTLVMLVIL